MKTIAAPPAEAPTLSASRGAGERRRGRGPRSLLSPILLIAALIGGLTVAAMAAPLFGIHLVRLETGSMAPTHPAGSLLLVRDVPAQSVQAGDIVTVRRGDGATVTHRVVMTRNIGAGAEIRMKGDANNHEDPAPYLATRVGLVWGGVPALGTFFALADGAAFVPIVAVLSSALVLWAWWPPARQPAHRLSRRKDGVR